MKQLVIILALLACHLPTLGQTSIECYDVVSDEYLGVSTDYATVRKINGGTVIIPDFDSSCPEQMKAPFSFACKIVEEYLPPCLPLKVNVSCGRLSGSYRNAISKVIFTSKEYFGETD